MLHVSQRIFRNDAGFEFFTEIWGHLERGDPGGDMVEQFHREQYDENTRQKDRAGVPLALFPR